MSEWQRIRALARSKHEELLGETNTYSAEQLLSAAEKATELIRRPLETGDSLLAGGFARLDPATASIYFDSSLSPEVAVYFQAHECGHHWREGEHAKCYPEKLDLEAIEDFLPMGVAAVEGYSPHERTEVEANVFAREFLIPTPKLRRWFLEDGLNATEIATQLGVLEAIVHHQLMHLLMPVIKENTEGEESKASLKEIQLDPDQLAAATVTEGPVLIEAGPGTGKTSTLQGRIRFLIEDQRVDPSNILAVTFSNKAAEEMHARVARVAPNAAPFIWMGTFHAFGLELLRKFGSSIGYSEMPTVLDQAAAVLMLEGELNTLQLDHYLQMSDPAQKLIHIVGAISRAKDEMVSDERYYELAQDQLEKAETDKEIEAAQKALEVAGVYSRYEELLLKNDSLDFGDLIYKTVLLLQKDSHVRGHVSNQYKHILVDEFQDVNHASTMLLREIAGDGKGLWVVGDARQSIYRFRGAAPRNVREFPENFPRAKRLVLGTNYRSRPAVVSAFETFARTMPVGDVTGFQGWQAHRAEDAGTVTMEVADNLENEVAAMAQHIQQLHDEGVPYFDQAVLCGSHTNLGRVAALLEAAEIPVLYIGDLFEREEVRDMLALISFASETGGAGLVRVGQFPEYRIPIEDIVKLLQYAREREAKFPEFLDLIDEISELSEPGRVGLTLLKEHLAGVGYSMTAWTMMTQYLFNKSDQYRRILKDTSVVGLQRQLALHQFLAFLYAYRTPPEDISIDPKRWFLETVRRLQLLQETKRLRGAPEGAEAIDAVRLLTLHASKGLEFDIVYLPILGNGKFPFRRQSQPCPPPTGLVPEEMQHWQDAEEACLFFVALSRARDQLFLSRATSYGKQGSKHLPLLDALNDLLPPGYDAPSKKPPAVATPIGELSAENDAEYHRSALETYMRCPRKYLYRHGFHLANNSQDSAYGQMQSSVREVLSWYQTKLEQGSEVNKDEVDEHFKSSWEEHGPKDHSFEDMYREYGVSMLHAAMEIVSPDDHFGGPQTWSVNHLAGKILLQPDQVITKTDGRKLVRRTTTGKIKEDADIDALYYVAAVQELGEDVAVEVHSLSANETVPIAMSSMKIETRISHYGRAMSSIQAGMFDPSPSPWCPGCPYYFICPSPQEVT